MDQQQLQEFQRTVYFIKILSAIIGVVIFIKSRYAFIFFIAAMIPTIVSMTSDKKTNRSGSATICTFNLIGVIPYLHQLWHSGNIDVTAKLILGNIETWFVIYFMAFIGQILIWFLPDVITTLYLAKSNIQVNHLQQQYDKLCEEWGIEKPKEEEEDIIE